MTNPPQPVPGNPYAQPVAGNPYATPAPPQANPYGGAPGYPAQQPPYQAPPMPQQQYAPPQQQFQAPQAPQAPQQQFQAPQAPQQQFQAPQAPQQQSTDPNAPSCRFCGAQPAVEATVRSHKGQVFRYIRTTRKGPFCRTCGIASVRDLSADTLLKGWWGYSSWIQAPVILFMNLFSHNKIKALPEPMPGQPGRQLDTGSPLLQRPAAIGLAVPVLIAVVLIAAAVS
jgi:hypothetical protein